MPARIAIIADFDASSPTHVATEDALRHSAAALGAAVELHWVSTQLLAGPEGPRFLAGFHGFWIGPGSPYVRMAGALFAIRLAREAGIPLLGTCGGFQHIILEHARNVLGLDNAEHEESSPDADFLVISRLTCSLVGREMAIQFAPGSRVAQIYGKTSAPEQYLCNFGVNPDFVNALRSGPLAVVGSDSEGEVRAVESPGHPFFVGTLFLPQHRSTPAHPHPLVTAFLQASLRLDEA
jgi:CTP synthase (UTP-ammonia lyase)